MASQTPSRTGSWSRGRLAQAGIGIGVAASVLATAAVATAAPQVPAAHAPAQASVAHVARHTVTNPYSSVRSAPIAPPATDHDLGNAPRNAPEAPSPNLPPPPRHTGPPPGPSNRQTPPPHSPPQTPPRRSPPSTSPTHLPCLTPPRPRALGDGVLAHRAPGPADHDLGQRAAQCACRKVDHAAVGRVASKQTVNGIPAIRAQVLVNGKYSATATVRSGLKPTMYAVMGTFQGNGLDTVAWMTVR